MLVPFQQPPRGVTHQQVPAAPQSAVQLVSLQRYTHGDLYDSGSDDDGGGGVGVGEQTTWQSAKVRHDGGD